MNVNGDFTLNEGKLALEFDGATPGTGHDLLDVSGSGFLIGGVVEVEFNDDPLFDSISLINVNGGLTDNGFVSYRLVNVDASDIGINSLGRSEEHTSELQSLMRISYAVFCL